ncbi:MAG: hypothetical protein U0V74_17250 [Chitinophagales bacterium]
MDRIWIINIYNAIKVFSDINAQKRIWLGKSPTECSSFLEDFSMLYDSYAFEAFLSDENWSKTKLNSELRRRLLAFNEALTNYNEKPTDTEILNDPEWYKVVNLAKEIIKYWDHNIGNPSRES